METTLRGKNRTIKKIIICVLIAAILFPAHVNAEGEDVDGKNPTDIVGELNYQINLLFFALIGAITIASCVLYLVGIFNATARYWGAKGLVGCIIAIIAYYTIPWIIEIITNV